MRAPKRFSGVAFTEAPVLRTENTRTSTLKRGLVQLPCCDQQPKSSQPQVLGCDASPLALRRATPPPRNASVCPLDNGGLRGVRLRLAFPCISRPCYLDGWKYFAATSWPIFFPISVPTSVEVR